MLDIFSPILRSLFPNKLTCLTCSLCCFLHSKILRKNFLKITPVPQFHKDDLTVVERTI